MISLCLQYKELWKRIINYTRRLTHAQAHTTNAKDSGEKLQKLTKRSVKDELFSFVSSACHIR